MPSSDSRYPDHTEYEATPIVASELIHALTGELARTAARPRLSELQATAWTLANMSYQVPDGSVYRASAVKLYRQDMHDRVLALFSKLDAQNAELDAHQSVPAGLH